MPKILKELISNSEELINQVGGLQIDSKKTVLLKSQADQAAPNDFEGLQRIQEDSKGFQRTPKDSKRGIILKV